MIGGLLDNILKHVTPEILEQEGYRQRIAPCKCVVIAHVHAMPSVVPLFKRLIELGFKRDAIIIAPKPYSTIKSVQRALRHLGCEVIEDTSGDFAPGRYDEAAQRILERACRRGLTRFADGSQRCVLIDDGGMLTDVWHRLNPEGRQTISVQQTASGIWRSPNISLRRVDVARSAAKRFFEASIIAAGVLERVKHLHVLRDSRSVGVIGMGYVGRQIAGELLRRGKTIYTYDMKPEQTLKGCESTGHWSDCFQQAAFIFGCTGADFMKKSGLGWVRGVGERHLVSLSSRDIEFQELLRNGEGTEQNGKFGLIKTSYRGAGPFVIMNGGFPINFDRQAEWESEEAISLTRALVLLGALQTLYLDADVPNSAVEKLSLSSQRILVETWLEHRMKPCTAYGVTKSDFANKEWWHTNSGGSEYKGKWMSQEAVHY
jgi:hypothetical protein